MEILIEVLYRSIDSFSVLKKLYFVFGTCHMMTVFDTLLLFFGTLLYLSRLVHSANDTNSEPTIIEYPFNEIDDFNAIINWMKDGKGDNTMLIIAMITKRTNAQRQKVRARYKAATGKELIDDIYDYTKKYSKKHPNYAKNIKELFRTPIEFMVTRIKHAIKNCNYEYATLMPTLISVSSVDEIKQIEALYPSYDDGIQLLEVFNRDPDIGLGLALLAQDLFGQDGFRSNAPADDKKTIALQNSIPKDVLNQPSDKCSKLYLPDLSKLLTLESYDQIKAVGEYYNSHNNLPIYQFMINRCRIGLYFAKIFRFAMDSNEFFADEIHEWVTGDDSKGSTGTRIVIQRCEIDLQSIKAKYKDKYKAELLDDFTNKIKDDSANIEIFKALINGNRH